jgi:hypothetical protein
MRTFLPGNLLVWALMSTISVGFAEGPAGAQETNSVLISTSLPIREPFEPELALDGKLDTCFQSARSSRDGDDFTLTLPEPMTLQSVQVVTGQTDGSGRVEFGAIEISQDGFNFSHSTGLTGGEARISKLPEKVLTIRLRMSGNGPQPVVIREFIIKSKTALPPARFFTRAETDYSAAPECGNFARRSKTIVEEWYPRIRELLVSDPQPPRRSVIKLQFVPGEIKGFVGFTTDRGTILISSDWISHRSVRDYGLVVHELTHVVQQYEGSAEGWLTEGIADYVRDYIFEPGERAPNIDPAKASYRDGYLTTAAFLDWLEKNKHPGIIGKLNAAARHRQPTIPLFRELTGKSADELWAEFLSSHAWEKK